MKNAVKTPQPTNRLPEAKDITILGKDSTTLSRLFAGKRGETVNIVVAFASKTENVVRSLLENNRHVTLTVGTINHFTDPAFIKHCVELRDVYPNKLKFYVDYRGNASIHWKLYMFSPNMVIVGSPNLTIPGVTMSRETAVCIEDTKLYSSYVQAIEKLHKEELVINAQDGRFEQYFKEYTVRHREFSTRYLASHSEDIPYTKSSHTSFLEWYERENTNIIPLYIWDSEISVESLRVFKVKVAPKINKSMRQIENTINVVAEYKGAKKEQLYFNGDIILMMDQTGNNVGFVKIDVVIYAEGRWWLCQYTESVLAPLFEITPGLERVFRAQVRLWYHEQKMLLNTEDLRTIARLAQSFSTL